MACLEEDLLWVLQHFPVDEDLSDGYTSEDLLYSEEETRVGNPSYNEAACAGEVSRFTEGQRSNIQPSSSVPSKQVEASHLQSAVSRWVEEDILRGGNLSPGPAPIPNCTNGTAANDLPVSTPNTTVSLQQAAVEHLQATTGRQDENITHKEEELSAPIEPTPSNTVGMAASNSPTLTHITRGKRINILPLSLLSCKRPETGHLQTDMSRQEGHAAYRQEGLSSVREPTPHSTVGMAAKDSPSSTHSTTGKQINILSPLLAPCQRAETGHHQMDMSREEGHAAYKPDDLSSSREPTPYSTIAVAGSDSSTMSQDSTEAVQQAKVENIQTCINGQSGHATLKEDSAHQESSYHSRLSMAAVDSSRMSRTRTASVDQAKVENIQTCINGQGGQATPKEDEHSAHQEPTYHSILTMAAHDSPRMSHIRTVSFVENEALSPQTSSQDGYATPNGEEFNVSRQLMSHSTHSKTADISSTPTNSTTVPLQSNKAGYPQPVMSGQSRLATPREDEARECQEPTPHSTPGMAANDYLPTLTNVKTVPQQQAKTGPQAQMAMSGQSMHVREPTPQNSHGLEGTHSPSSTHITKVTLQQAKGGHIQTPVSGQSGHLAIIGSKSSAHQETIPHTIPGTAANHSPPPNYITKVPLQQAREGPLQTTMSGQELSAHRVLTPHRTLSQATKDSLTLAHMASVPHLENRPGYLQTTMSGQGGPPVITLQEPSAHGEVAPHSTLSMTLKDTPTWAHSTTVPPQQARPGYLQTTMSGQGRPASINGQEPSAYGEAAPYSTLSMTPKDTHTWAHSTTVPPQQARPGYLQTTMSGQGRPAAINGQEPSAYGEAAPYSTLSMTPKDTPTWAHGTTGSLQQGRSGHLQATMPEWEGHYAPKGEESSTRQELTPHSTFGMAANDSPTSAYNTTDITLNIESSLPVSYQQMNTGHHQTTMCRWDGHAVPHVNESCACREPISHTTFNMASNESALIIRIRTGIAPVDSECCDEAAQPSAQPRKKRARKSTMPKCSSSSTEEEHPGPFRHITPPDSPALTFKTFKTSSRDSDYVSATGDDVEPGDETTSSAWSNHRHGKSDSSTSSTEQESEYASTEICSAESRCSSAQPERRAQLQAMTEEQKMTDLLGKIAGEQTNVRTTLKDLEARKERFRREMLHKQEDIVAAIDDNSRKVQEFTCKLGNQHMELMSLMTFWCLQMVKTQEVPGGREWQHNNNLSLPDIPTFKPSHEANANQPGPSAVPFKKH